MSLPRDMAADGGSDLAAVDLGPLANMIGFALRRTQDAVFRALDRELQGAGLLPGLFASLVVIQRNPGITHSLLAKAIGRDASTLTPLLAKLERQGLIRREPGPTDRRQRLMSLTEAGEDHLQVIQRTVGAFESRLDSIVGDSKDGLLSQLERIVAVIGADNAS